MPPLICSRCNITVVLNVTTFAGGKGKALLSRNELSEVLLPNVDRKRMKRQLSKVGMDGEPRVIQ